VMDFIIPSDTSKIPIGYVTSSANSLLCLAEVVPFCLLQCLTQVAKIHRCNCQLPDLFS
jgi:hypothetical protein